MGEKKNRCSELSYPQTLMTLTSLISLTTFHLWKCKIGPKANTDLWLYLKFYSLYSKPASFHLVSLKVQNATLKFLDRPQAGFTSPLPCTHHAWLSEACYLLPTGVVRVQESKDGWFSNRKGKVKRYLVEWNPHGHHQRSVNQRLQGS